MNDLDFRILQFSNNVETLTLLTISFENTEAYLSDSKKRYLITALQKLMTKLQDEGEILRIQLKCGLN